MAITNFIPTVWSEHLYRALDKKYVAVKNCNREFEGEIKGKGSSVKICGVGGITISDYTKDTDLSAPETLSDNATVLTVDRAKCFNFQIDDIDRAQATPKLMEEAMKEIIRTTKEDRINKLAKPSHRASMDWMEVMAKTSPRIAPLEGWMAGTPTRSGFF